MAHPARSSKVRLDPRLSPLTNPATRCPEARQLYDQPSVVAATAFLKRWYFWATQRRLAPIIDAARTIKRHQNGILRWFDTKIANGLFEGLNSLVQAAKAKARGYRTTRSLIAIVYLLVGKLDLAWPASKQQRTLFYFFCGGTGIPAIFTLTAPR